jgi:hypothetical protein
MTVTYQPISTQTLGTATGTVSFTSISGAYTDLVLVVTGKTSTGAYNCRFRLNGDTGSNYSFTELYGTGSSAASSRSTSQTSGRFDNYATPSTTGMYLLIAQFMNYSNSTTNKTVINRSNNAGGTYPGAQANVNLWRNTAAITQIDVSPQFADTWAVGSTFTLYGIKAE